MDVLEKNKHIVKRFNEEVIQNCNEVTFRELMHVDFINRSAPEHANDSNAMWNTFSSVLKPAFPDLTVEIFDQVAEGDKVTTRKAITGTHKGVLMGIAPTQQKIRIDVIDIVRLQDGKYIEHWGINTLQTVLTDLRSK
ncbi:ester cyclase [Leptospira meyeri]|uniref:ester cyclase n=1 Tax=Leptospira meyeri TaxID=29508 RepID=UPI0002BD3BEE|nr:ester cyclase [Leptospira meyeri]EMJ87131.1 SnoaL-like polyketide cyclase [Leptospira meyeri serovar Semaranga str. Veldrot Semarang 173]